MPKPLLLFLLLLFVIPLKINAQDCIGQQTDTVTPLPGSGNVYSPGQQVTFSYTLHNWLSLQEWFHGLTLNFCPGWDTTSLTIISIPNSVDGFGHWNYYPADTSSITGQRFGVGFYYDSPVGGTVLDSIPGNNFGDFCQNTCSWQFVFSLKVSSSAPYGQSLALTAWATGDATSGDFTVLDCADTTHFVLCSAVVGFQAFLVSMASTNANGCPGNCNGTATAHASLGTLPFSYTWSTVPTQTDSMAINLCPGTYFCTITDSTGATITDSIIVGNNYFAANFNIENASCDSCNGAITTTLANGTAPFTYNWSNGVTVPALSNLCEGALSLTISDAAGCTITDSAYVNQISTLTILDSVTNDMQSQNLGSIYLYINSNTGPYIYLWNTNDNTSSLANLSAGVYTVTVTDAHGCSASASIQVYDIGLICANSETDSVAPLPAAGNTYSAAQIVTFYYTLNGWNQPNSNWFHGLPLTFGPGWDNTSAHAISLPYPVSGGGNWGYYPAGDTSSNSGQSFGAGFYFETVAGSTSGIIDANPGDNFGDDCIEGNCIWTFAFSIQVSPTAPAGASLSLKTMPLGDGSSGSWVSSGCTDTLFPLCTATVGNPAFLIAGSVFDSVCAGTCTATASVHAWWGTPPYSYMWSTIPVQTDSVATDLCPGAYTCTATDFSGATAVTTVNIVEFDQIVIDNIALSYPTCNGLCNGQVLADVGGGVYPLAYVWSDGQPSSSIDTAVCAGTLSVTVTDGFNCTASTTIILDSSTLLTISDTLIATPTCTNACAGIISTYTYGGSPPYNFVWSDGQTQIQTDSAICPGLTSVTVTDALNCAVSLSSFIDNPVCGCNAYFSISLDSTEPGWYWINDSSTGNNPHYLWSFGDGDTSTLLSPTHTYLVAGSYLICLTINDTTGCTSSWCDTAFFQTDSNVIEIRVNSPLLNVHSVQSNSLIDIYPNPATAQLFIKATGPQPEWIFIYDINGQKLSEQKFITKMDISNLSAGIYFVELKGNGITARNRFIKMQ